LHRAPESVQVNFQNLRLGVIWNRNQCEPFSLTPLPKNHIAARESIANPLRVAAACNHEALATKAQDIDRGGVVSSALSPADYEKVVVGKTEAETDEKTEKLVEKMLDEIRPIINCLIHRLFESGLF